MPTTPTDLEELSTGREPLPWEDIPLPPGFDRHTLEPAYRAMVKEQHQRRRERILAERVKISERCEGDPVYQQEVLALCAVDQAWWIDHFCWTYDDRVGEDEIFVLYPFQVEKCVTPYRNMLATTGRRRWTQCVNKSRGIGWTWTELALRVHSFLFRKNHSVLVGAVDKAGVDDGGLESTHQSLLGKVRHILRKLPRWMRDALLGPDWEKDRYNKHLLIKNPLKPKNLIAGKQFGGMFSRSQRWSEIWGDEIAHAAAMKDADKALKQATDRFCGGSTPLGKSTLHYQLMSNEMAVVRFTIHWSEHPDLDADWYNEQRKHMSDEDVASELDCSFEGSAGGRVLKHVNISTHFRHFDANGEDLAEFTPTLPLQVVIDPGIADDMAVIWCQWDEGRNRGQYPGRVVDFVQTKDRSIDWIVPFIIGYIPSGNDLGEPFPPHHYNPMEHAIIRRHAEWGPPKEIFGDRYGTHRELGTGLTAYEVLEHYGISVIDIKVEDDVRALEHLRHVLRYVRFASRLENQRNGDKELVPTMGEVVTQWRYPKKKDGDYRPNLKPLKDMYDHGGDCLKMWADTIALPETMAVPVGSQTAAAARGRDTVGGPARWRLRRG